MYSDTGSVNNDGRSFMDVGVTEDKVSSNATVCDVETPKSNDGPVLFGRYSASFLKERGNVVFKSGDYFAARELYTNAIVRLEHSENDALAAQLYCNRAACHIAMDDFDSAVSDATEALMLDRSYVKVSLRFKFVVRRQTYITFIIDVIVKHLYGILCSRWLKYEGCNCFSVTDLLWETKAH
ncbi:hypothetical protein, conserved [Babesia bigemina]|uniref:Uncharacterized protein n=1 Tax=Babesia bigemina TaxID=5866 RepID=A0A061DBP4_BABBI|nr:hypothetical protein, conserved [Babesia bigemina]CDR97983.1 hypothetical protein, conserved [Babesia bigemina]|eukprot:XP_012770169.1 hypothetical protein, conserved [Babesia bigemina]